jgi:hypothetical protein
MKPVRSYCLRIWFTAVLIAPVIIFILQLPSGVDISFLSEPLWSMLQLITYMLYMIFFGLLLSAPCFILFYLITSLLSKLILNGSLVKLTLSVVSVVFFIHIFLDVPFTIFFKQKELYCLFLISTSYCVGNMVL